MTLSLARAIHVMAIVHWIGGIAVVTTIVLPKAKRIADPEQAVAAFEVFEHPFAFQARGSPYSSPGYPAPIC